MVIKLFSPDTTTILPSVHQEYKDEINALMCSIESFCYMNKIKYSYSKMTYERDKITAFLILKHEAFAEIDSHWSMYIVEMIRDLIEMNILLTVQDTE